MGGDALLLIQHSHGHTLENTPGIEEVREPVIGRVVGEMRVRYDLVTLPEQLALSVGPSDVLHQV